MRKMMIAIICGSLVLLNGCARNPDRDRAMHELEMKAASTVPICMTEEQCLRMMDAAELWVVDHSEYRIRDITRNRIATHTPLRNSSTDWFYQVTKRPYKEGNKIVLDIGVRNPISKATDKDEMLEQIVEFNTVIGSIL
jgi:hypothetical protein